MRRRKADAPGAALERESRALNADSRVTMVTDSKWLPSKDDALWYLGPEIVWIVAEYMEET